MKSAAVTALVFSLAVVLLRFDNVLHALTAGGARERTAVLGLVAVVVVAVVYLRMRALQSKTLAAYWRDGEVQWGLSLIVVMLLLAIFAPIITEHDPQYALYGRLRDWSAVHWLGTDAFGRDALSRIVYGARISLSVALTATTISVIAGILVGVSAALGPARVDNALMRLVDAGIAFPRAFLLLALFALTPRVNLPFLVVILGLTSWFDIARLVRAEVLAIRNVEFLLAANGLGLAPTRKLLQHILPNVAGPIIVSATLTVGYLILIESGLSYIGVGLPAGTPSWGTLINEGYGNLRNDPHLTLIPGALIAITVIGFSLIGDGVRRSLDPRRS